MISGLNSSYSNPYSAGFASTRFGNSESSKPEEKKAAEEAAVTAEATSMDALYRSPQYRQFVEERTALDKEEKDYQAFGKYDQYWQTGLIAGSAATAFLGQFGLSAMLATYPLGKCIYTTLKRLGEWNV